MSQYNEQHNAVKDENPRACGGLVARLWYCTAEIKRSGWLSVVNFQIGQLYLY